MLSPVFVVVVMAVSERSRPIPSGWPSTRCATAGTAARYPPRRPQPGVGTAPRPYSSTGHVVVDVEPGWHMSGQRVIMPQAPQCPDLVQERCLRADGDQQPDLRQGLRSKQIDGGDPAQTVGEQ